LFWPFIKLTLELIFQGDSFKDMELYKNIAMATILIYLLVLIYFIRLNPCFLRYFAIFKLTFVLFILQVSEFVPITYNSFVHANLTIRQLLNSSILLA